MVRIDEVEKVLSRLVVLLLGHGFVVLFYSVQGLGVGLFNSEIKIAEEESVVALEHAWLLLLGECLFVDVLQVLESLRDLLLACGEMAVGNHDLAVVDFEPY